MQTTFRSNFRPSRGGIEIAAINRTRRPDSAGGSFQAPGSLGYNVVSATGTTYLLTAGHVANLLGYANGITGDTITQQYPDWLNDVHAVATVTINPAWDTGANSPVRDSTTMVHYDFCTTADVLLATYMPGITAERKIVAGNEGQNGASGLQTINGYYGIKNVLPPDMVPQNVGVHKSGRSTGTRPECWIYLPPKFLFRSFGLGPLNGYCTKTLLR